MKINGSLVFDASSASEIQNLRIQKYTNFAAVPTYTSADAGRLVFAQDTGIIYYGSSATNNWVAIATGGNAAALQTEVDNTQAAIGAAVNNDGTFNAAGIPNVAGAINNATSITNAINQLASNLNANNELAELDDVTLTALSNGQFLRYDTGSSRWVNHTLVLANVTDVTVPAAQLNLLNGLTATAAELNTLDGVSPGLTAAELNILDGATLTTTELNYVTGVTAPIQTQLNNKQALDATLTALAGLDATAGIVVQTGTDAFTKRTLQAPAAGITILNPAGTAGDPTFALANDLAAIEGLVGTGYVVRTGDGTATTRSISGAGGRIVISDGDGVASNTDVDLATVSDSGAGTFLKFTRDTYGRVSGTQAVVASDITGLVDSIYVNANGDTMTGNLNMGSNHIILESAPTNSTHAVNKQYVDSLVDGLTWKTAVRAATTANINLTSAPGTIDGVSLNNGNRVLVKNQTTASENGIYVFNGASNAMTRAADMDAAAEFYHAAVFVTEGATFANTGWTETSQVIDLGSDPVTWQQFTGGSLLVAGTGLSLTGNTFDVNLGAGIFEGPSDAVGIDLYSPTASALILTEDGTTRANPLSMIAKLHLLIPAGAGVVQDAAGLYIPNSGVTNAMLANSTITINADNNSPDPVSLGQTILFSGNSVQGIDTTVAADNTINITARNASASQKGVASFDATEFSVTAGNVVLGTIGNNKLANSTITIVGTSGSDPVALGESLTFSSTVSGLVSSTVASNGVALDVRLATASLTGVASFNSAHFSVSGGGAVSLAATLDDLDNVSSADGAATGDLLTKTAGDWQATSRADVFGSMSLGDLGNVGTAAPTDGHVLTGNGTQWEGQKIYHLHEQTTPASTWTVAHNIGQQYCNVTVIDAGDEVVIPQSITFTNANSLQVTFNTAIAGKVVVMGIA